MANPKTITAACPHASASFLRLNPQLGSTKPPAVDLSHDPHDVKASKPTLRQKSRPKLNKTESAFLEILKAEHPGHTVRAQSITLILANGVRYTPDVSLDGVDFYEVKGFMRDDAAVKLKVAASQFTEYGFHLVKRDKSAVGGWRVEEVLP